MKDRNTILMPSIVTGDEMAPNDFEIDLKNGLALIGLGSVWLGAFYVVDRLDQALGLHGWLFWMSMAFVSWLVCQMFGAISQRDPSELWKLTGLLKVIVVAFLIAAFFKIWMLLIDTIGAGWALLVMVAVYIGVPLLIAQVMVVLTESRSKGDAQESPNAETVLFKDEPDDES